MAVAAVAEARAIAKPDKSLDIAAGSLRAGIAALSEQTGVSVGMEGPVPAIRIPRIRGKIGPGEALRRMLRASGLRAVQTGPGAYRLTAVPPRPARQPPRVARVSAPIVAPDESAEIIVTGLKRDQRADDLPLSFAVLSLASGRDGHTVLDSRRVALEVEGLTLTNLGPGRNRAFIRGVVDSPFSGPSQSTVAVLLDEARVTFDAPDPELRLVDISRVEVLKGPQGPLWGSGALGGIYHMVTREPETGRTEARIRTFGEAIESGGFGAGLEGVINLPIARDTLAVRAVGYAARDAGWIDIRGRDANANHRGITGGRMAVRWRPTSDVTVDFRGLGQISHISDSQYVTEPDEPTDRVSRIPERTDTGFRSASLRVEAAVAGLRLTSVSSLTRQSVEARLDASSSAALFGLPEPITYRSVQDYQVMNAEIRVAPARGGRWIAGASFLKAASHNNGTIIATGVKPEAFDRKTSEIAVFAETVMPIIPDVEATAGARLFRTSSQDDAVEGMVGRREVEAKTGLTPSLALKWTPAGDTTAYLRYARAFRPGGLAPIGMGDDGRFDSDQLSSYDLGIRRRLEPNGAMLNASLFYMDWHDIQSDYLLPNGLISTRNVGNARIFGAELSAEWPVTDRVTLSGGASFLDARLTERVLQPEWRGQRLPVAPRFTARLSARHGFALGGWSGDLAVRANYVGRARLSFDPALDRPMSNYALFTTNLSLVRGRVTLLFGIDNLTGSRNNSFAFGNPFSIRETRQYTPIRPRTFSFSIAHAW